MTGPAAPSRRNSSGSPPPIWGSGRPTAVPGRTGRSAPRTPAAHAHPMPSTTTAVVARRTQGPPDRTARRRDGIAAVAMLPAARRGASTIAHSSRSQAMSSALPGIGANADRLRASSGSSLTHSHSTSVRGRVFTGQTRLAAESTASHASEPGSASTRRASLARTRGASANTRRSSTTHRNQLSSEQITPTACSQGTSAR